MKRQSVRCVLRTARSSSTMYTKRFVTCAMVEAYDIRNSVSNLPASVY